MTWGIKISPPGVDVKSCPDDQLVFSSEFNTLKTFNTYRVEPSDVSSHGLNYQPIFLYASYLADKPVIIGLVGQNSLDFAAEIDVDDTYVRSYTTSGFSADALVYVFYDEL